MPSEGSSCMTSCVLMSELSQKSVDSSDSLLNCSLSDPSSVWAALDAPSGRNPWPGPMSPSCCSYFHSPKMRAKSISLFFLSSLLWLLHCNNYKLTNTGEVRMASLLLHHARHVPTFVSCKPLDGMLFAQINYLLNLSSLLYLPLCHLKKLPHYI